MTTFWWVRHAPTHQTNFTGWRDVPADLSDGSALDRLADYLPQEACILSSDLERARHTADRIARDRRRLPDDAALREFDFGAWDGLHHSEVTARDPDLARRYWEMPGEVAPPGGESWNRAAARLTAAADRLAIDHAGGHLILVSHFGAILTQLQRARGCSAYEVLAQRIDPLSVTCLRLEAGQWSEALVNYQP
jgi:broad specificity phosphatase PhoE